MVDRLSRERRSWLMSRVGSKNTSPEIAVRKAAHALGLRFRLHRRDLPGTPDLVFPGRKLAVFVHGCYWHRHRGCSKATIPSSEFWAEKFRRNVKRDRRNANLLEGDKWRVVVIWECETKSADKLSKLIRNRIVRLKPRMQRRG